VPIYEYRCRACRKKSTILILNPSNPPPLVCRHCGGGDLEKLVSRIAILRSEDDRMENLAASAEMSGLDEDDPRSVARWMKKMGREMGEDVGEDIDRSMEEAMGEGGEGSGASDGESGPPGQGLDEGEDDDIGSG
jgi:putative FmdB family regulatory protein